MECKLNSRCQSSKPTCRDHIANAKNCLIPVDVSHQTDEASGSTVAPGYAFDKNGVPILPGDTLKIFHFIGARKKRHFMYKFVESVAHSRLVVNHLGVGLQGRYTIANTGQHQDIEVVQGYEGVPSGGFTFEDRKKLEA